MSFRNASTEPQTYVSVPTEIVAMQWTGEPDSTDAVLEWCGPKFVSRAVISPGEGVVGRTANLYVDANESWLPLEVGEWVAKDSHGFYPIKNDIFENKYRRG